MIKISDTEYFSNDGTIRFLQMDCNEFMAGCKDNEFDLNLSDPPYGLNYARGIGAFGSAGKNPPTRKDLKWDNEIPTNDYFIEQFRVSKNQIIFGGNYFTEFLKPTNGWIIWDKIGELKLQNPFSDCELAWTSFNRSMKKYVFKQQGFIKDTKDDDRIHPTQKPSELYVMILNDYTKPNDNLIDCFGGSMSSAIACHKLRRNLTIIELDNDYFKKAVSRFDNYEKTLSDTKEFGYAKSKLDEINPTLF